jgi:putative alpha-1,2-mannosidase
MEVFFYHLHFDMTNEPGFLIPMLFNWAGRPDLSADAVSAYLEKDFLANRAGIPGNDDSGAMSSWLIFQSLGFYPNAGQDVYLLGTPRFPEVEIRLQSGKVFRILAKNLDAEGANRYIQSATLNGLPLEASWFRHSEIKNGATLTLVMGPAPTNWGTTAPPPSLSDTVSPICVSIGQE